MQALTTDLGLTSRQTNEFNIQTECVKRNFHSHLTHSVRISENDIPKLFYAHQDC